MDGYTIAEAADLAGIPATTLRYYEDEGVIASPARAENGYRQYAERDVDRLRFLGRARRLDLSPGDLKELAQAWDTDSCASVQHGLSRIVGTRLAEAQCQVGDLVELSAELQRVAARLTRAPKEGPCDEQCACSPAGEQIPVRQQPRSHSRSQARPRSPAPSRPRRSASVSMTGAASANMSGCDSPLREASRSRSPQTPRSLRRSHNWLRRNRAAAHSSTSVSTSLATWSSSK